MSLYDAVSQGARVPDVLQQQEYIGDAQYHSNYYMLEDAMRELGVLPKPMPADSNKPYDDDLRRLIAAVPLE